MSADLQSSGFASILEESAYRLTAEELAFRLANNAARERRVFEHWRFLAQLETKTKDGSLRFDSAGRIKLGPGYEQAFGLVLPLDLCEGSSDDEWEQLVWCLIAIIESSQRYYCGCYPLVDFIDEAVSFEDVIVTNNSSLLDLEGRLERVVRGMDQKGFLSVIIFDGDEFMEW